jgi:hypothetical protein
MKGVVQLHEIFKVGSKTNVVESILNWVHGKNVSRRYSWRWPWRFK